MAEIDGENGDKVVVLGAAFGRVRVGLIHGNRLLPLRARDHVGCDLTLEGARELREALDGIIEEMIAGA